MSSDWRDRAACLGMDTNLFYPATYNPVSLREQRRLRLAMATCAGCPVRPECLADANERTERFGIWGGQGEHTRKLRRDRERRARRNQAPVLT